ncbi:MAG: 5-(carboxyamino)imidazole ribonucleotide synthase [Pseudomonadota bacterium]|nr:5-(carboxyamino)imidazole ribonucleotide synthase [Pseudomonadota bacterium]
MNKNISVGILGGGQLGMMLCQASGNINIKTHIYCPDSDSPAQLYSDDFTCMDYLNENEIIKFSDSVDIITYEFENIPKETLELIDSKKLRPGIKSLEQTQDRLIERKLLQKLDIPCAPYVELRNEEDFKYSIANFGESIIKTKRFGYDGKGQIGINENTKLNNDISVLFNEAIIEKKIPFEFEFSQVSCRDIYGNISNFPLTRNIHENHILKHSYAPLKLNDDLEIYAKEITKKILSDLEHIGVLTVEFFKTEENIIVNEIAPRVHNSGHWTIEGCSDSQFQMHMQAVSGIKIKQPELLYECHMENLIGNEINEWINKKSDNEVNIHLYNKKEVKNGRKMGHLTYIKDTIGQ